MRGFLDCYGFRPEVPCITLDEMLDDESEDMMDLGEQDDDYLAAMDDAAWEEFKAYAEAELFDGEDQGDWVPEDERA